jgi:ATP-dependent RNA helicase DDX10/DBP4
VEDKELAREKRRAKKEKKKEKERAAVQEGDGDTFVGGEDEDGEDAMANFIRDAQGSSDEGSADESEDDGPKAKKAKKWFQEDSKRKDLGGEEKEIETMEDLEAVAARLLG